MLRSVTIFRHSSRLPIPTVEKILPFVIASRRFATSKEIIKEVKKKLGYSSNKTMAWK